MSAKTFELSEDWVVVILGFGIIGLALLGFVVPVPSFGWSNSALSLIHI